MKTRESIRRMAGVAVIGAVTLLAAPAGTGAAGVRGDLDPATRTNLQKAMSGEAFANARYQAYGAQATVQGLPDVRTLFDTTANTELREHFTEQAKLVGLVGDNAANLRNAIKGESYEAAKMYNGFAAQAKADGDTKAAELFTEIAKDEARHRDLFTQALKAITQPSSGATVPTEAPVAPKSIKAGRPQVSSQRTLQNLGMAMVGESVAHAKYTLYGDGASRTGQPALAALFQRTAQVELSEHFAELAQLGGLVGDTKTNLCGAILGETREGRHMYPDYARQANAAGDHAAAQVFTGTGKDELRHAQAFTGALTKLGGRCPTPS